MTSINGEWDLTPDDLAVLFALKGWAYASPEFGYGVPDAASILEVLNTLIGHCANAPGGAYSTLGRFIVLKDDELPNSFDVYLRVAYVWDDDHTLNEDEKSILDELFGGSE